MLSTSHGSGTRAYSSEMVGQPSHGREVESTLRQSELNQKATVFASATARDHGAPMNGRRSTNASRSHSPTPTLEVAGDGSNVPHVTTAVGCSMAASPTVVASATSSNMRANTKPAGGRLEHDDDSLPPKPKGMHWATYERLARRYEIVTGAFACETSFRKWRSTMFGFKALLVFTSILVFTVGISTLPVKADGHAELKAKTFDLRRPNLTTTPACQPYERTDTICRAKGMYCTQYHANCCNPPKYWTFYWNKYGRCA